MCSVDYTFLSNDVTGITYSSVSTVDYVWQCLLYICINLPLFLVQAELRRSLNTVSRPTGEHLTQSSGRLKPVCMELGLESVTDIQGSRVERREPTEMEVSHDVELSVHSSTVDSQRVKPEVAADVELNATMNHTINIQSYPFPSEPDEDLLNESIMIDPSNPFDEDMISKVLSKLAQPLSSYKNCHYVNSVMPKISVRGALQLGMFLVYFCCFMS